MGVWGEGLECRRVQVLRFWDGRSLKFALLICAGGGLNLHKKYERGSPMPEVQTKHTRLFCLCSS